MGPDEAGNVRAVVSRVVTYPQAVKQEESAMWKCADGSVPRGHIHTSTCRSASQPSLSPVIR